MTLTIETQVSEIGSWSARCITWPEMGPAFGATEREAIDRLMGATRVRLNDRPRPIMVESVATMPAAERFLGTEWRDLRNSCDREAVARVQGAIDALGATGALSDAEHELWFRRIKTCPGHDDEGGRSWCAYCGTLGSAAFESVHMGTFPGRPGGVGLIRTLDGTPNDPPACHYCGDTFRYDGEYGSLCGGCGAAWRAKGDPLPESDGGPYSTRPTK